MRPTGARVATTYPARAASVACARNAVSALAAPAGASADELDNIRLAVSEAVTNAVVHAYPAGASGPIYVTAAIAGSMLSVIVADDGCGLGAARDSPGLGLGLNVLERACDSLAVGASRSGGTRVEMRFVLSDPAAGAERTEAPAPPVASRNPLRFAALLHDHPARAPHKGYGPSRPASGSDTLRGPRRWIARASVFLRAPGLSRCIRGLCPAARATRRP